MDGLPGGPRPTCVLVLQGGGALGAYHVGAYRALQEQRFEPDWVCGISVGAINAAVIAGNPPDRRLERLQALWDAISWPELLPAADTVAARRWTNTLGYAQTIAFGQPGFFAPRPINPYLALPGRGATSFYDTSPLYETLRRFADFDQLNNPSSARLSVGATDVETGGLVFFDNRRMAGRFGPEHVVASGSLPPGFPPTPIGGRLYWDGGCVSNTPLEAVLDDMPVGRSVVFVIDLWSASGPPPATMDEVQARAKQILYASRTAHHVDSVATKVNLRHAMQLLAGDGLKTDQRIDIVHIVYHPGEDQITASDAEFSRASIAERHDAGYADMRRALEAAPWHRAQTPAHLGCIVHRVTPDAVTTFAEPNLGRTTDRRAAALPS